MGKVHDEFTPDLITWVRAQHVFFVASAPNAAQGLVNCSPKGMDSLRVLDARTLAYLDLSGSGVETIAHLRENGRIVLMWCAFAGPPKILRVHGIGDVVLPESGDWVALRTLFPDHPGARAIVRVRATRIADSCGYAVPLLEYRAERDTLTRSAEAKGEEGLRRYRREKNALSLDGLPGLEPAD